MPKKRTELIEGEYDQITENMNRMRKRFMPEVLRDVGAWLLLHWLRHDARVDAANLADQSGNREWAAGVRADAMTHCQVITELFADLHEAWTVKDWHAAQKFMDGMISARDDSGRPLHVLGKILSASKGKTDGTPAGQGGGGVALDSGDSPPVLGSG